LSWHGMEAKDEWPLVLDGDDKETYADSRACDVAKGSVRE